MHMFELAVILQLNNELLASVHKIKFFHVNSKVYKGLVQNNAALFESFLLLNIM